MPGGIGPLELAIILVIVLVVFGPKRLPTLGRQLGSGMREFKESITGKSSPEDDDDEDGREAPRAIAASETETIAPAPERRDESVSQQRQT
jgi:sec-independent protein translocase protein TatA